MKRLFIGLSLPQDTRDSLYDAMTALGIQGQLTRKDNYHLTLAFLGEHDNHMAGIEKSMQAAARTCAPLPLLITGFGYFGRRENALLFAKLQASQPLDVLADTLRIRLSEYGEMYDDKPFTAHITLARKVDLTQTGMQTLAVPLAFTASEVTLYHSARVQGILRYRPIYKVPFPKGTAPAD